jgi:hypothetical protein
MLISAGKSLSAPAVTRRDTTPGCYTTGVRSNLARTEERGVSVDGTARYRFDPTANPPFHLTPGLAPFGR